MPAQLPPGFQPIGNQFETGTSPPPPGFVLESDLPAQKQGGWFRTIDDIIRSLASGVTFGGAEELAAGMGALTGFPGEGTYEQRLAAERARDVEIPLGIKIPGEITGAVGTGLLAGPAVAGTKAAEFALRLPGWARAAGLGGLFGGLFGFGTSEGGPEERLQGAGIGAGLGAVLGPPGYYAGRGVETVGRKALEAGRTRFRPESAAQRATSQAFAADEITPSRAAARLRELGPQATIADVGGANIKGVARAAAAQPGPAKNRAEVVLKARAAGEAQRVAKAAQKGLQPDEYYAAEEAFLRNMREQAAPLYQAAYQRYQSIISPGLNRLLKSRTGQQALKETAAIVADERAAGTAKYLGAIDQELTESMRAAGIPGRPGVIKGLSLEAWDQIKRGFDSLLDRPAYRNELTGRLNARGRAVDQMRRRLIKELDKATGGEKGAYATARAFYAGEAEALQALREGRKAIGADPEAITRRLTELSETGVEAYRSGFGRAIKDIVDKTPDTSSIAKRIWGNVRNRARLRAIFPDQKSYNEFSRVMAAEMIFSETKTAVLAGSRTAPMLAEMQGARRVAGALGAVLGSELPAGGHALVRAGIGRRIMQGLIGPENPQYYRTLSRWLVGRNQAQNRFVLDHLRTLPAQEQAGRLAKMLTMIGGVTGGRYAGSRP